MIAVAGEDGRYYVEPVIVKRRWCLTTRDDSIYIQRKGKVLWKTARADLPKAGLKCRLIGKDKDREMIMDDQLTLVSVFEIKLLKPIPVPTYCSSVLSFEPAGEGLIRWV